VGGTRLQCTKAFSFFPSLNANTLCQDLTSLRGGPKTAGGKESLSSSHKVFWPGHSPVSPKGWRRNFLTRPEAPVLDLPSHVRGKQTTRSLMLSSWFLWPKSGGHLLLPVLQYCLWAGSTWTAGMINNPSCVEPGNSLFPQPSASLSSFPGSSG
jgi:hypothetical protein